MFKLKFMIILLNIITYSQNCKSNCKLIKLLESITEKFDEL